jgi:hypothetical protein
MEVRGKGTADEWMCVGGGDYQVELTDGKLKSKNRVMRIERETAE